MIGSNATAPLYNIIIIFDTVVRQNWNFKHEKIMNSIVVYRWILL